MTCADEDTIYDRPFSGGRGGVVIFDTDFDFPNLRKSNKGEKGNFTLESRWINIIQHGNLLKSIDIIILEFVVSAL